MTWINVDESNDDNDDDGGGGEGGKNRSHACACVGMHTYMRTYMRSCIVVNFEKHVHVHDEQRCCNAAGGRDSGDVPRQRGYRVSSIEYEFGYSNNM